MRTWTDLSVATRLGLRELGRRMRNEVEPAPDGELFEADMQRTLDALPPGVVAEHRWIRLPGSEPPWRDTGLALDPGAEATLFCVGRVYASRPLDIWVAPRTQIWTRIGEEGPIQSSSRDSITVRAERRGSLFVGNYFPNDWKDARGARVQGDAVHRTVSGETRILAVRWAGRADEGLAALARVGNPLGLVGSERERLALGSVAPEGWHYLWHVGEAEIFRPCVGAHGEAAVSCDVQGDVAILQRSAPFPLAADTEIAWRWRVDALPGLLREDSVPSHDYLSLAVEFANGKDLTYYWSRSLAPGKAFWCPLPNWKEREFHVVVRSGTAGLGEWHAERRNLHEDALQYLGGHPGDVVAVWLIAVSVFKRQPGRCVYADIRLRDRRGERIVL